MQHLDVISVNLWQILISLANLVLLFLAVKKFLYRPVKEMMERRRLNIEEDYDAAREARHRALAEQKQYEKKLKDAKEEAQEMVQEAAKNASFREKEILAQAKEEADRILVRAKEDADLEMKKAEEQIRREIAEVSASLTEKLLSREADEKDHDRWITSFTDEMGEEK